MFTARQQAGVRKSIDKIDSSLTDEVVKVVSGLDLSTGTRYEIESRVRDALLENVGPIAKQGTRLATQLASSVYNALRYAELGSTVSTVSDDAWDDGKFAAAVNTAAKKAGYGASAAEVASVMSGYCSYTVKASYGKTMYANAASDPIRPRYARVPSPTASYSDGCPFCRMLAGRGFVYLTAKTAGEMNHYHADCSCLPVPSWDESPRAEGYDPEQYRDQQ